MWATSLWATALWAEPLWSGDSGGTPGTGVGGSRSIVRSIVRSL